MSNRIRNLVNLIIEKHPEILTYYELSNYTGDLNVEGLVRAYSLNERYGTSFKTAVRATYFSIKRMTKKKCALERLEKEYPSQK